MTQVLHTWKEIRTLGDLLEHRAKHLADSTPHIFLVNGEDEEARLSHAELDLSARRIAAQLAERFRPGDRLLLLYPPGLEFIRAFFGCVYASVVPVPLFPPRNNRNNERFTHILDDVEPAGVLTDAATAARIRPILETNPDFKKPVWVYTDESSEYDPGNAPIHRPTPDEPAFIQYTSGSTSRPKGVVVTHANLLENLAIIRTATEVEPGDRTVYWLPQYHDLGLIAGVIEPLYSEGTSVLLSPFAVLQKPLRWLQAIQKYESVLSGGPNFSLELCVNRIAPEERDKLDLSCWDIVFNGAEPLHRRTMERFAEYFAPAGLRRQSMASCYGLAEGTLMVTSGYRRTFPRVRVVDREKLAANELVETDDPSGVELMSSGRPMGDYEIAIVDPGTLRETPQRVGEIWLAGSSVASGYWNNAPATTDTFAARLSDQPDRGPFLRTGDLGFMDDGQLFVCGRLKEMIIVRGKNLYPHDIEQEARDAHEAFAGSRAAAFSVEGTGTERLVLALEVPRVSQKKDLSAPGELVRSAVTRATGIELTELVLTAEGRLPVTSSGKIQRVACRRLYIEEDLEILRSFTAGETNTEATVDSAAELTRIAALSDPNAMRDELTAFVQGHLNRAYSAGDSTGDVSLQKPLFELGLDSMKLMDFKTMIDKYFGVMIPIEKLFEGMTAEQMIDFVMSERGVKS
jgi:acyl-CoA synthetase (AMP-forming)/AMP-acid ligase II/acyl carrier protein